VGPSNSVAIEAAATRLRERRRRTLAGLTLIAAILVAVLMLTGWLAPLELVSVDARFAVRGTQAQRARSVVIVGIDERTIDALRTYPLPRRDYAQALDRLRRDGARLVAIDLQFTEPTTQSEDDALIEGLRRSPGTILMATATGRRGSNDVLGGASAQRYARVQVASALIRIYSGGTFRRFDLYDGGLPTLPVRVAQDLDPGFSASSLGRSPVWIDYAGGPGTFRIVSLVSLLRDQVPASVFRGRIVILGATALTTGDIHAYSALAGGQMTGPEIEANAVSTALEGAPLREIAGWLAALISFALVLGVPPLLFGRRGWRGPAILAGAVAAYLVLAQVLFDAGQMAPVAIPVVGVVAAGVAAIIADSRLELRARAEQVIASRARAIQAADEARRRVERDLHDGVQQRLLALAMRLGAPGASASEDLLRDSVEQVRTAIAELRDLARGAYPAVLAEAGLAAALESLADRAQLPVSFHGGDGLDDVADTVKQAAYFIAAESLANAIKHAGASRVTIDAATDSGELRLIVADDGRGGANSRGSGLTGLAERAETVGGSLAVKSEPGAGTRIELRIPV
jgi:signal transduction histidine kinase